MRRLFNSVSAKANASFLQKIPKISSQRLKAFFLLLGMFAGTVIPTASAYAQVRHRPDSSNPNIEKAKNESKKNKEGRDKPMKQNYPEGMRPTTADEKAAADAKPLNPKKDFRKPNKTIGEALQGVSKRQNITPRELVDRRTATSTVSINEDGSITSRHQRQPLRLRHIIWYPTKVG